MWDVCVRMDSSNDCTVSQLNYLESSSVLVLSNMGTITVHRLEVLSPCLIVVFIDGSEGIKAQGAANIYKQ